ncbi:hypothetical protein Q6D67_13565 [Haliea sp. E1-2-M8]|uniref:hypothetical protein n=1 Tax=Haliea sp. E1-2-M8 TaxID=3064706 RepID=UPI0027188C8D|nr:hypothetical protein [Haliea sp. E1-2-M8]MDO8862733.1 hypothetical protein [Haliea sp. E1-2-M8]
MFASLTAGIIAFSIAALVIVIAGSQLARVADELADRTGMGEALFGILLLAGVTSLPDFAATLSAALDSRPDLAMSNIMGSMAVNLVFLGIADMVYRQANLEHAAASPTILMLAALLIVLLTLPLLAIVTPPVNLWGVHPVTPLIVLGYVLGLDLVRRTEEKPMWFPRHTRQTVADTPEHHRHGGLAVAWLSIFGTNCFNMLVVAAADAGYPGGSIYHDMAPVQMTWGRIGFESALILAVYALALVIVVASG